MMHRRLRTAGIEVAPHYHQLLVYDILRSIKVPTTDTICCAAVCYTRGPHEMFVQLHGMTALLLLQLLYAAAVNCCHNTYQRNTCHRPDCGERAAPCQRILPRPLPPLRSQNQCRVQRSVTGTRVQSNPSARSADLLIYILLTRVTKSYLLALGTTQISSFFTKH